MWQRFTESARKVIFYAQEEAMVANDGNVSPEHMLLGLLKDPGCTAVRALSDLGVNSEALLVEVRKRLKPGEMQAGGDMTLTPRAKRVIDLAYDSARNLNNNYIGTEHLLLGLVRENSGISGQVLKKLKVKLRAVEKSVMTLQGGKGARRVEPTTEAGLQLTVRARAASVRVNESVAYIGEGAVSTEHILLAMTRDPEATASRILDRLGVSREALTAEIERRSANYRGNLWNTRVSPRVQRVLDLVREEATAESAELAGTSHYLLAIVREEYGIGAKALLKLGVDEAKVREAREGIRKESLEDGRPPPLDPN